MSCPGNKEPNEVKWVGVRPTDPEGDALPVKLQDANCQAQGITANPLIVEDLGTHTNPERYIHLYAFRSAVVAVAGGVATALYTTATTPARIAGTSTDIWWIFYYNGSGVAATVWLEAPTGTQISNTIQLANNQSVAIAVKPLPVGDTDILVNASANGVEAQIGGISV